MLEIGPPITALYVGLNAFIALIVAGLVVRQRGKHKIGIGDGGNADLLQAIRVQGNFVEYVPLALLIIYMVELGGTADWAVHGLGIMLTVGRIAHAQGLSSSPGQSAGRGIGTLLTWLVYIVGGALCIYYGLS